jgi:hypothetical protein
VPHRENSAIHSHAARHDRDSSAETGLEDNPNYRQGPNQSPRRAPHRREEHDPRNEPSGHSPPDGVQGTLRNDHSGEVSYPKASSSAVVAENQDNHFPVQPQFRGDGKGKSQGTNDLEHIVPETDAPKMSASQGDNSSAAGEAGVTHLIDRPLEGAGDEVANYVDKVGGSSANPQSPRKRSAGLSVHPRNRTLSESVQAYLSRPVAPRYLPKKPPVSGDEQPAATGSATADTRRSLLLRLTDGPDVGKLPSPRKTTVEMTVGGDPFTFDDAPSEQHHHGRPSQSCIFSSNHASVTVAKHADAAERGSEAASVDDQARGRTDADMSPSPVAAPSPSPSVREADSDASGDALATLMSVSVSGSVSTSRPSKTEVAMDVDVMAALEKRLRARARVRVRLAAIKDAGGAAGSGLGSGSG